jgi:hypothetical protein
MTNHYRFVDRTVAAYVKSQIESGDRTRVKNELQHLCRLYRRGYRLQVEQAVAFENTVVGLLYTQRSDEKVRRWALNALARLGKEASCMQAILETLGAYNTEPQTAAAAIAAIYRISRRAEQILRRESYDRQMVALAALQHVDAERLDLSALPVDVETASPDLLRLALLVVGLNRAPANLLNPRHTNAEMVRALGAPHDGIVSQYSVWAITENPSLGVSDLGINIKDIEQQPPNVRAWIFQLLGMRPNDAEEHLEYLRLGMEDPSAEARAGLASGLKNAYFDGLDPLMLDWFLTERDSSVRLNVLDHLVTQAHRCPNYEAIVLEVYEKEPRASRERMRANAAGTRIFGKFAAVDLDGSTDLFRQGGLSIMNNFNFTGPINAGAFAAGGVLKIRDRPRYISSRKPLS